MERATYPDLSHPVLTPVDPRVLGLENVTVLVLVEWTLAR